MARHPGTDVGGRVAASRSAARCRKLAVRKRSCFPTIVDTARVHEGRARIGHINRAVNLAIRPISDLRRFGVADEWAPPLGTLQAGAGDCEDYAILKLQALREAGFAAADLKLVIVRDSSTADQSCSGGRATGLAMGGAR